MSVKRKYINVGLVLMGILLLIACQRDTATKDPMQTLLSKMTLEEKVGQLYMRNADDRLGEWIKEGKVGAILNEVDPDKLAEYQRIAREDTRLGIPLLTARDVIHG
ncbi:MAG: glycosyl hydrolase, partial [Phototrophicales bacterium]